MRTAGRMSVFELFVLSVLCVLFTLVAGCNGARSSSAQSDSSPSGTGTVLVTGSNRGLGLEFVKQYGAAGWTVIATARHPEGAAELQALAAQNEHIRVEQLDVADDASIAALAAKYRGEPIDVLINNAGVLGDSQAQRLGSLDRDEFEDVMSVNVFGALAVAEAFREQVAASGQKKIVSITSRSGILSRPGWRGPYFYRASKVALNMTMKMLAEDLRESGVIVGLLAPPPTDTDMLRDLIGPDNAAREADPADSVRGLIEEIDRLTLDDSGRPLSIDGTELPW